MSDLIGPPANAPPRPDAGTCATCGTVVEPVWIPAIEKPRWWVPSLCAGCLTAANQRRRQQQEEDDRRTWLRERVERSGIAGLRRAQTFETFRPEPGTRSALAAAQQFAKACTLDPFPRRGVLFVGRNGSGKTHLVTAIGNCVLTNNHTAAVLLVRFSDYLLRLRETFADRGAGDGAAAGDLRQIMATIDLLALDDLGAAAMTRSEWDSEELARVLEDREVRGLPIIATCDLTAAALAVRLGERIVSRLFGMCDLIPMTDGKPGTSGYVVAADYRRREQ